MLAYARLEGSSKTHKQAGSRVRVALPAHGLESWKGGCQQKLLPLALPVRLSTTQTGTIPARVVAEREKQDGGISKSPLLRASTYYLRMSSAP